MKKMESKKKKYYFLSFEDLNELYQKVEKDHPIRKKNSIARKAPTPPPSTSTYLYINYASASVSNPSSWRLVSVPFTKTNLRTYMRWGWG